MRLRTSTTGPVPFVNTKLLVMLHGLGSPPHSADIAVVEYESSEAPRIEKLFTDHEKVIWRWVNFERNRRVILAGRAVVYAQDDVIGDVNGRLSDITVILDSAASGTINAREVGLSGDGATDNGDALQTILEKLASIKSSVSLYFPSGIYAFDLARSNTAAIFVEMGTSVIFRGDGPTRTVLKGTNYPQDPGGNLFYVQRTGNLRLENLKLEGPDTGIFNDSHISFGIYNEGGGSSIILRDVHTSLFQQAILMDGNLTRTGGKLHATNCQIRSRGIGVRTNDGNDRDAVECVFINCDFSDDDDATTEAHHNLYISNGVSLKVLGCRFTKSRNRAIRRSEGNRLFSARFNIYSNCFFGAGVSDGVETTHTGETLIENCVFETGANTSVVIKAGGVTIRGCIFTARSDASYAIDDSLGSSSTILIDGCSFNRDGGNNGLHFVRHQGGFEESPDETLPWIVTNCRFYNSSVDGAPLFWSRGRLTLRNCEFYTTNASRAGVIRSGKVLMENVSLFGSEDFFINDAEGKTEVELVDCRTLSNVPFATIDSVPGGAGVTLSGRGNKWFEHTPGHSHGLGFTNDIRKSGQLRLGYGQGVYLLDAGVLTIDWNADFYELDEPGTPDVHTIQINGPNPGVHNNALAAGAILKLRAKQPFKFALGGNISDKLNAPSVSTLVYSADAGKWFII